MIGDEVEEYCRIATGKTLPGPDEDLNRQVVESINTCRPGSASAFQIANILKNRLQMKNSHKQWLAVLLVQKILQECGQMIAPARGQIIQEVAHIAAKPMNRYSSDLPGQQKAKTAAFGLLRNYGREGSDALRGVAGIGRGPMSLGDSTSEPVSPKSAAATGSAGGTGAAGRRLKPWPQLREAVQTAIATANSHTEMMQDMLLNLSKEGSDDYDFQRGFLNDLVGEIRSFRNAFEQLLASLANHDNEEANSLMVSALETVEMMNNALQLKEEVTRAKDDPEAPTPPALQSRLAQPVGQSRAAAAPMFGGSVGEPTPGRLSQSTAHPASSALPTPQASPFDAILELQQALAEPGRDPFAVSQSGAQQGADPFASMAQGPGPGAAAQQAADPFAASTNFYGGPGGGFSGGQQHPLHTDQALPAYPVSATMSAANPFAPGVSFPQQQQTAAQDPFAMPSLLPPQANAAQQNQFASPARQPYQQEQPSYQGYGSPNQPQQPGFAGYGSPSPSNQTFNSPVQPQKYPGQALGNNGSPYQQPYGSQPNAQNGYAQPAPAINGGPGGGYGSPGPTPAWSHQTPHEAYPFPQASLPQAQQQSPTVGLPNSTGQSKPQEPTGSVHDRFQQHKQARHAQQQSVEMQQLARPVQAAPAVSAVPQQQPPSFPQPAPSLLSPGAAAQVAAPRATPTAAASSPQQTAAAPQANRQTRKTPASAAATAVPNGNAATEDVESEWDMFFADRVGSASTAPAPAKAKPALSPADEFDELVQTRRTSDQ
ncbi:hypothetical protein WJX74_004600 [Apatococcus lobatus]|uniref:VHS domain-containing protein n=1 Tax=Apatococcus lobatus TaxID=904363 RepID=A0AAW1RPH3_9CHLO